MKMPVRILSLVLALLFILPYASLAEIDFSQYTLNELIQLKSQITEEIASRPGVSKTIPVPMGEYIIGIDIPAGTYTLKLSSTISEITIRSSEGKLVGSYTLLESSPTVGKIELQEGQQIEINYGPILFSLYKGLNF